MFNIYDEKNNNKIIKSFEKLEEAIQELRKLLFNEYHKDYLTDAYMNCWFKSSIDGFGRIIFKSINQDERRYYMISK